MIDVKKWGLKFVTLELDKGVRVIHIPSGLYADCAVYRDKSKNESMAMDAINEKLTQE